MIAILTEPAYGDWLNATPNDSGEFLRPYVVDRLVPSGAVPAL
jgi:hypothetical protein